MHKQTDFISYNLHFSEANNKKTFMTSLRARVTKRIR